MSTSTDTDTFLDPKLTYSDIRLMIYDLCFARDVCIVPAVNFHRRRPNKHKDGYTGGYIKYSAYKYQWAGVPQRLPEWGTYGLPSRDGSPRVLPLSWTSEPTEEQLAIIALGGTLPDTEVADANIGATTHSTCTDTFGNYEIFNHQNYFIRGIFGVKLLRTCKQLRAEGTVVLYCKNTFDFSSEFHQAQYMLKDEPRTTYGPPFDGALSTNAKISQAINEMFEPGHRQPRFFWTDPFAKFMIKIGQYNAGLIKSVRFNGGFKNPTPPDGHWDKVSLAQTLPIYTMILKSACRNLKKVTLQTHTMGSGGVWPDFTYEELDDSDREGIDGIVGKFVDSLPNLRQLCLGSRSIFHGQEMSPTDSEKERDEIEFGEALRWVDLVAQRPEEITGSDDNDDEEMAIGEEIAKLG